MKVQDMKRLIHTTALMAVGITTCLGFVSCFKDEPLNAECDIEQAYIHAGDKLNSWFLFDSDTLQYVQSDQNKIEFTMSAMADLTQIAPLFRLTPGATISPANGSVHDFSKGSVKYTVTSEDGQWSRIYFVSIRKMLYFGSEHEFNFENCYDEAEINYLAAYVQDEIKPTEKLLLIPSIRYDHSDMFGSEVDTAVRYKDNIFQSENVSSPFVLGIINPRIYLPFSMNEQDMEHVVAHEQAHICRKDHLWKPLGFFLLTIHWFNPLMWLAYVLLCRDIELACDEKVIKGLGNEQRADYTQALVACSVNRRRIAACPLAFGEVGVKERVKSVMNYKKPAFWVIIIAVNVCVGVAICFLTNPKQDRYTLRIVVPAGSQEEFVYTDEEVSTVRNSIKIWSGDGLGDTEVLLFPVNKTAETGYTATYLTHGMPVEFDAEKDTWFKIGVNMQNSTNEDIIVYVEVENVEVRIVDEINSVIEWFDYLETPDEMKWDGSLEISLTEFPDVTFRWTSGEMLAVKGSKSTSLYTGMPIWNAYFCDLTGDGLPELCSSISWGSGMIDNRVIIYDYANGVFNFNHISDFRFW